KAAIAGHLRVRPIAGFASGHSLSVINGVAQGVVADEGQAGREAALCHQLESMIVGGGVARLAGDADYAREYVVKRAARVDGAWSWRRQVYVVVGHLLATQRAHVTGADDDGGQYTLQGDVILLRIAGDEIVSERSHVADGVPGVNGQGKGEPIRYAVGEVEWC